MTDLASISDLEDHLGRALTDVDVIVRAESLLTKASARAVTYMGQEIVESTSTSQVKVRNGIARLPQRPVTAVSGVVNLAGGTLSYSWLNDDRVQVGSNSLNWFEVEPFRNPVAEVRITYTHGYDEVPADIVGVVCQMAARALGQAPDATGMQQESIAGYSYTVGGAAASGPVGLMADEKAALDVYRRVGGSIRISP
jgi:hypothetical protein